MKDFLTPIGLFVAFALVACSKPEPPVVVDPVGPINTAPPAAGPRQHTQVDEIARAIANDAGTVAAVEPDGLTGPVLVLEENHAASTGQLNQALLLTRAYERYGLRTVVVEGYSDGDVDAAAGSLRKKLAATPGGSIEDVGAALVSDGELTAAEYVALVHPDIHIAKGATGQTAPLSRDEMVRSVLSLKLALALVALEHDVLTKEEADSLLQALTSPPSGPQGLEQTLAMLDGAIRRDPWTAKRNDIIFPDAARGNIGSIEETLDALQDVKTESSKLPSNLASVSSDFTSMEGFLRSRSAASSDLSVAARKAAAEANGKSVALVIGMGHTAKVCAELSAAGVPYAVIQAKGMDGKGPGNLIANYQRKFEGRSVSPVFDSQARPATVQNRARQTIDRQWLVTKARLYEEAEAYAHAALHEPAAGGTGGFDGIGNGGNGGNRGNGGGLSSGDSGNPGSLPAFFFFDNDHREIVKENGRDVVIARVTIPSPDGGQPQTMWVKLAEVDSLPIEVDAVSSRAERALKNAIVAKSREALHAFKDVAQIRLSENVLAQFSPSREHLLAAQMSM